MGLAGSVAPHKKCLLTELEDGSGVLLHLDTKFYYTLNATAVAVWKAIQAGPATPAQIAAILERDFEVDRATAERDADATLNMLLSEGLAEPAP